MDVRDVAAAHIRAMENPEAEGRYIVANESIWMEDLVKMMRRLFPDYHYPSHNLSSKLGDLVVRFTSFFRGKGAGAFLRRNLGVFPEYDTAKSKADLGLVYTPLEKTLRDLIEDLQSRGLLGGKHLP